MQKLRQLCVVAVIALIVAIFSPPAFADSSGSTLVVNNSTYYNTTPTVNQNGITLAGARDIAESLGGSFKFDYSSGTGTVELGENQLVFTLDSSTVKHNGKYIQATAAMKIIDNRFMVPVGFTAEKLGYKAFFSQYKDWILLYKPINGKITYSVRSGDTLWIISQHFGVSITSIRELNGLASDYLYVGQKLTVMNSSPLSCAISAFTSNNATLSTGAGFSYSAVGYLKPWTSITITGKDGDWYHVTSPLGAGYVHQSVVFISQTLSAPAKSTYFTKKIPFDSSKDYITYNTYTVQKYDSIWSISQKLGIPDYELANANGIAATAILTIGQALKVPVHHIPVKDTPGAQYGEVLDWFSEAQYIFPTGTVGKLTDIATGKSFMAKRTMGANHSDTEPLTAQDATIMKNIFGGTWNWNRRPFILEVGGRRFAVSVAGMAHAGVDGAPYLANVANRSDNYGYGPNYDFISGNGMDGHFDLYFLNCITHNTSSIDPPHQYDVLVAGGLK